MIKHYSKNKAINRQKIKKNQIIKTNEENLKIDFKKNERK